MYNCIVHIDGRGGVLLIFYAIYESGFLQLEETTVVSDSVQLTYTIPVCIITQAIARIFKCVIIFQIIKISPWWANPIIYCRQALL